MVLARAASVLFEKGLFFFFVCSLAHAQTYPTMAGQPDPRDFVAHADTHLTVLGVRRYFAGFDISWLGLRQDGTAAPRRPTLYEVRDALVTAQAMGESVVLASSLTDTAGCDLCLETPAGDLNPEAFAAIDQVLDIARDLGVRVILPLAGAGQPHTVGTAQNGAGFFSDDAQRARFLARVDRILNHVNAINNTAYRNDPTIFGWENCDGCGAGQSRQAVSAWTEALGQAIKATDALHIYINGAFAGQFGAHVQNGVPADLMATPSVDAIVDHLPPGNNPAAVRPLLEDDVEVVTSAHKAYILDSFGWNNLRWKSVDDLQSMLDDLLRNRAISVVLTATPQTHAESGGYLPPLSPPAADGTGPLYYPPIETPWMRAADMLARDRALRVFDFVFADVVSPPAPKLPPKPQIISAIKGFIRWRGAAAAATYTIERSADPDAFASWTTICDQCVTDTAPGWQDPAVPAGPVYYRMMPFNVNGHKALPSDVVQNQN